MNIHNISFGMTEYLYNIIPPFHPDINFPELSFKEKSEKNEPYSLIRNLFFFNKYDIDNYNKPSWNPLKHIIRPNTTVVIKPNFVLSENQAGHVLDSVITHPSIIRAAIDYSFIALNGKGKIIIADAPQMDCNWDQLMVFQALSSIIDFYKDKFNFDIEVLDLRNFELINNKITATFENRRTLKGDPLGSVVINLGENSEFFGLNNENYYGADFNYKETQKHHNKNIHEYCISKTILSADTIISIPKLKVHKKVGVTLNLKGLVGINTDKNYLIHYTIGSLKDGGDQYPLKTKPFETLVLKAKHLILNYTLSKRNVYLRTIFKFSQFIYKSLLKKRIKVSKETQLMDSGNWHGNDSAWRMTVDLLKIIYFSDKSGIIKKQPQRNFLSIIDGIIGGEDNGPLSPTPKYSKCIILGDNLIAADAVATRLMNFNIEKIKQFEVLNKPKNFDFGISTLDEICVNTKEGPIDLFNSKSNYLNFIPHQGWINNI